MAVGQLSKHRLFSLWAFTFCEGKTCRWFIFWFVLLLYRCWYFFLSSFVFSSSSITCQCFSGSDSDCIFTCSIISSVSEGRQCWALSFWQDWLFAFRAIFFRNNLDIGWLSVWVERFFTKSFCAHSLWFIDFSGDFIFSEKQVLDQECWQLCWATIYWQQPVGQRFLSDVDFCCGP